MINDIYWVRGNATRPKGRFPRIAPFRGAKDRPQLQKSITRTLNYFKE